jgi:proteasome lid subunit RPN8/RPN11
MPSPFFLSVSNEALQRVMFQAKESPDREVIGVLIGRMDGEVLVVEDAVTGAIESEAARATMPTETIAKIADDIVSKRIRGNVVGWYHSHPGLGVYMSSIDVATQAKFQQFSPYIVALVVDPSTDEVGFYTLEPGTMRSILIGEEYTHLYDPGEDPIPPNFRVHPELPLEYSSPQSEILLSTQPPSHRRTEKSTIDQLSDEMRSLELELMVLIALAIGILLLQLMILASGL